MSGFNFKITAHINAQDMANILITAIESGDYGSVLAHRPGNLDKLLKPEDVDTYDPWYAWVPLAKGGRYIVTAKGGDERGTISRRSLQRGLELLQRELPHLAQALVNSEYDVIAADALLQAAAFGEVIYG